MQVNSVAKITALPLVRYAFPHIWCLQPEQPWPLQWQERQLSQTCTPLSTGREMTLSCASLKKCACKYLNARFNWLNFTVLKVKLDWVELELWHPFFSFIRHAVLPESLKTRQSAEPLSLRPWLPRGCWLRAVTLLWTCNDGATSRDKLFWATRTSYRLDSCLLHPPSATHHFRIVSQSREPPRMTSHNKHYTSYNSLHRQLHSQCISFKVKYFKLLFYFSEDFIYLP